ncbi:unnamed protein product [Rhizoctonia solani]|uniref:Uncharacterized protein n=1 Tax=Rhizoctonia solani TaxID=456999 RepID=A0A8H3A434_9AGAM|nr:unnamed protein product [Rhizoctonia solani]
MVSRLDETSSFHFYHLGSSPEPIIRFEIGDMLYLWDTQRNSLYERVEAEPLILEFRASRVPLYTNLREAEISMRSLQGYDPLEELCGDMKKITIKSIESVNRPPPVLPKVPPSSGVTSISEPLFGTRIFGSSIGRECIDIWAEYGATANQAARDEAKLKCPEP